MKASITSALATLAMVAAVSGCTLSAATNSEPAPGSCGKDSCSIRCASGGGFCVSDDDCCATKEAGKRSFCGQRCGVCSTMGGGCSADSDCCRDFQYGDKPLVCSASEGVCRPMCTSDRDCRTGSACTSEGVCGAPRNASRNG
ncbi:MAG: hypothetical protein WC889_19695 [Myxococcota bacterium]